MAGAGTYSTDDINIQLIWSTLQVNFIMAVVSNQVNFIMSVVSNQVNLSHKIYNSQLIPSSDQRTNEIPMVKKNMLHVLNMAVVFDQIRTKLANIFILLVNVMKRQRVFRKI
jgi:23S rRNA maturation-related 3'-5' exoribonuclease YhaM